MQNFDRTPINFFLVACAIVSTLFSSGNALAASEAPSPDPVPGYHNFEALTKALKATAAANSNLARVFSIGKSAEGRDVWVVEVGNKAGTPPAERPALLIVANLEGNQLVGSELSVKIIEYLLANYSTNDAVKDRLDNTTFYIIPRANPDGAERMFTPVQSGQLGNMRPMDDDNDGRIDEDGPDDLNRDGYITVMRVADAKGDLMIDPADPRLLKKADPKKGESGAYKVYWEGTDDDGDGFYNEDAKGGVDLNRNFQHEYPYYTVGAGPHMVSELESRAIMDFVISHRNIAAVLSYGPNDNLVTAPNNKGELAPAKGIDMTSFADHSNDEARKVGMVAAPQRRGFFRRGQEESSRTGRPSSGRKPETTINKDDQEYFKKVSEKYKEIVGLKELPGIRKPAGAFFEYGYYQFGVPSFATPGWAPSMGGDDAADSAIKDSTKSDDSEDVDAAGEQKPDADKASGNAGRRGRGGASTPADKPEESVDFKLLKWMDAMSVDGYVNWTAYDHPTLGSVEIGGFKPYELVNPPSALIAELGPKQGAFVVEIASMFARVKIAETKVTNHGGGVFRIEAEIENGGFLPTASAHGVASRSVKPTMVQLDIKPDALLSGAAKTSFFQAMDGSGTRQSFEWIVAGKRGDKVTLRAVSQKGGSDEAVVELR